ncbi:deoxyribodipyrimidine photo-lyase [Nocardioides marmoriginsengisoli]|uniref:Deoxyribodipyrimidine photo-lyase n=1 Tax=Nocardioides marmoriginsengisoli TaxID=661483 RepID=A0A3N0CC93_9ACTN|nr:deoxyribodipyrimidine photo-lyase [Nocardioides marmoriginsengisoli]RNL60593.1 deoxyribodipyrimidine photo-lyase [Nocardioides marmoriginsengisoli]
MTTLLWFRRDLRLADHPALAAAAEAGPVLGLFVVDPRLWESAGPVRRAWIAASVLALDAETGGNLVIRYGDPAAVVPATAREAGADSVHLTRETTPYGLARDRRVAAALDAAGVGRVGLGTPYAVDPGTVRTLKGEPYQVFTPFSRAWRGTGWDQPTAAPDVAWVSADADPAAAALLARAIEESPIVLPAAGSAAALARWREFRDADLADYDTARDLPAEDATSRLSPYLKVGAIHPRTLLADLGPGSPGTDRFSTELAWRDFYADVLWHRPDSAWADLRPLAIDYDDAPDAVLAWREGRTGYPIVDAGMRQLRHQGWMHNRVRMITGSFLAKDLHTWWPVGARHFLDCLVDGDLASNCHGWQWVAGTGTDASPYFRVFNPVTQGRKFDPDGDYVRRWVPELAHLPGAAAHEPWKHPTGYEGDYPRRIVDHDQERRTALDRYAARG